MRLFGHLARIDAQVQFQVDLGEIEQRESRVVGISGSFRGRGCRLQKLDRAGVLAAQVVEPGDVVVGLRDGLIESAARRQCARRFVGGERFAKVVERCERDRLVVNDVQQTVGIAERGQRLVRALVARHRFGKPVLPVHQVADRVVEPCQAKHVALIGEELASALTRLERLVVASEQQQRLHAGAERPGQFRPIADALEGGNCPGVEIGGVLIAATDREGVRRRTQRKRDEVFVADAFGHAVSALRESERAAEVDAQLVTRAIEQALGQQDVDQAGMAREEAVECRRVRQVRNHSRDPSTRRWLDPRRHRNAHSPTLSSTDRRRSRHFIRMKPIEPVAMPSACATSL